MLNWGGNKLAFELSAPSEYEQIYLNSNKNL